MQTTSPRKLSLTFTRQEGLDITTIAILNVEVDQQVHDQEAAFSALREAVTEWVKTTPGGRDCWQDSCSDLNIGDLANHVAFKDPMLVAALRARGIVAIDWVDVDADRSFNYDTVLVDASQIRDEDEELAEVSAS